MKTNRRNALHRAVEEMDRELKTFYISINPDTRKGNSACGEFIFPEHLPKENCKKIIRQQIRAIKMSEKIQTEFEIEDKQNKLL